MGPSRVEPDGHPERGAVAVEMKGGGGSALAGSQGGPGGVEGGQPAAEDPGARQMAETDRGHRLPRVERDAAEEVVPDLTEGRAVGLAIDARGVERGADASRRLDGRAAVVVSADPGHHQEAAAL